MTTIPATVTVPDSTRVEGPWTVVGSGRLPDAGGTATATGKNSTVMQVGTITGGLRF